MATRHPDKPHLYDKILPPGPAGPHLYMQRADLLWSVCLAASCKWTVQTELTQSASHRAATYQRPPVGCKQSTDPRGGTAADPSQMTAGPPRADGGLPAPRGVIETHRSAAPGHSLNQRVTQVHPSSIVHEEQRGSVQQFRLQARHDCQGGGDARGSHKLNHSWPVPRKTQWDLLSCNDSLMSWSKEN